MGGAVVMLLATGQIAEERVEGVAPTAPTPPPPPPANTLSATFTGISTWVKIDTTGLWTVQGGTAPAGTLITVDGQSADAAFTQPTSGSPIVTWLIQPYTHTLGFGSYAATLDCVWRGYPWKGLQGDSGVNANGVFFNGSVADDTDVPGPSNNWSAGAPYQQPGGLNNGYSELPDAGATYTVSTSGVDAVVTGSGFSTSMAGLSYSIQGIAGTFTILSVDTASSLTMTAGISSRVTNATMTCVSTSAVFIVAPGDEGFVVTGTPTADTRVEPNYTDHYALPPDIQHGGNAQTGSPTGGLDMLGNVSLATRYYRFDFDLPSTYTAPVTVQNTSFTGTLGTLSAPLSTGAPITSLPLTGVAPPAPVTPPVIS